jgi:hypothetical protein
MFRLPTLRRCRERSLFRAPGRAITFAGIALLAACANPQRTGEPPIDPDAARAEIAKLLPPGVENRSGWAVDIFAAFEALSVKPSTENVCAVVAVTEQESTFQSNPQVPGLPAIARREIDSRAARYNIPTLMVNAALALHSPTGASYRERLDRVKTEKELSDIFADFIGMVPLGGRLFASLNPVRTGGPMQVSIDFAEEHAKARHYPYPIPGTLRDEVFTRRGGMYFGIAHLLDYPAAYDDMLFRFADFNAGHYASRNAAFQNAVSIASKTPLSLDGDLLLRGRSAGEPSKTELAIRHIAARIELDATAIREQLELGEQNGFADTALYKRVFALAEKGRRGPLPRAMVPTIRLKSPKITRKLTTDWFARRVQDRYVKCLKRGDSKAQT